MLDIVAEKPRSTHRQGEQINGRITPSHWPTNGLISVAPAGRRAARVITDPERPGPFGICRWRGPRCFPKHHRKNIGLAIIVREDS